MPKGDDMLRKVTKVVAVLLSKRMAQYSRTLYLHGCPTLNLGEIAYMSNLKHRQLTCLRRSLISLFLLTCGAVFVMRPQPTYAQSGKATINGTVMDPTGAVVPDAKIIITNVTTGQPRDVTSAVDGGFTAPFLPVGQYSITVSHLGFKSKTQSGITLTTDQIATVNITLEVGQVTQTVEVSAAAQMINTTTAAIGQIVSSKSVAELPLNGRNPATLAFLAPGATNGMQESGNFLILPGSGSGMPTETNAEVNGSRQGGVFYMLDGIQHMDVGFMTAEPFPNSDATQEFRVLTNNYDAQYGFAPNGVVSVVTKSGTNNWHGDAFEFVRNDKMDAADFFSHVTDGLKRNQFGGSIGGPIKKDKAFIFGNLQYTQERIKQFSSAQYVPSSAMLTGDFSYLLQGNNPIQLHDYDGTPFNNNQIPTSMFDPVSLAIVKHLPSSSLPSGLVYVPGVPLINDTREFTIKHDLYLSDKSHISVRGFFQNFARPVNSDNDWLIAHDSWLARNQNYGGSWTYTLTPTVVNNFTFGYNRLNSAALSGIKSNWPSLGADFVSPDPQTAAHIWINASNAFGWTDLNIYDQRHNYTLSDTVSWSKGRHLIVAGVNVLTNYSLEQASWLADPNITFSDQVTGSFYSDFLLGYMTEFDQGGGEFNKYAGIQWAGFGQDTIRLKPNLTLNVGVRWEPWFPPHSLPDARTAVFSAGQQSKVYPNAPVGLLYSGDAGVPRGGYYSEASNLVPRLGIAWQPHALPNTSIRAAVGMFIVPYEFTSYNHIGSNAPFSPTFDLISQPGEPPVRLQNPWASSPGTGYKEPFPPFALSDYVPPSTVTFALPTAIPAIFTPDFVLPRQQSWNVSVEHQFGPDWLLRLAYVGTEAYHLGTAVDLNPGFYSTGGTRTLYPDFGNVLTYQSEGTSSYNGLQVGVEKRLSHGLQITSNYAWSKTLDELSMSDISDTNSIPDPYDIRLNRGISSLNHVNIWSTTGVWNLPSLRSQGKAVSSAFGNWELSGILTFTTGAPFSVVGGNGNDNSESLEYGDRADLTGQPLEVKQGAKSNWLVHYFNPAAFKPNAVGTWGDSARNLLKGPPFRNLDFMLAKNIPIADRYRLQFRWEMFNATNTPSFGLPDNDPSSGTFGMISSSMLPPRIMQLALKLAW
jgi:hypothetical protein